MKTRLIKLGRSKGIRLPKEMVAKAQLDNEVDVTLLGGCIIIRSPKNKPRKGWAKAAAELAKSGEDRLLDEPTPTRFDEEEWEW